MSRSSDLEEALTTYAALDLRLLPVHSVDDASRCSCEDAGCKKRGKHARINAWQRLATSDPVTLRGWWARWPEASIGAIPGPAYVVVDVDPRHGGDVSLARIEAEHGPLVTATVLTGRTGNQRGRHLWLRMPAGRRIGKKKIAPGLEVVSSSGYVLMPPSRHYSGETYEWLR